MVNSELQTEQFFVPIVLQLCLTGFKLKLKETKRCAHFFLNGEASLWSVCYQRGLPRLVFGYYCCGATIRTRQDVQYLQYARFFL